MPRVKPIPVWLSFQTIHYTTPITVRLFRLPIPLPFDPITTPLPVALLSFKWSIITVFFDFIQALLMGHQVLTFWIIGSPLWESIKQCIKLPNFFSDSFDSIRMLGIVLEPVEVIRLMKFKVVPFLAIIYFDFVWFCVFEFWICLGGGGFLRFLSNSEDIFPAAVIKATAITRTDILSRGLTFFLCFLSTEEEKSGDRCLTTKQTVNHLLDDDDNERVNINVNHESHKCLLVVTFLLGCSKLGGFFLQPSQDDGSSSW